MSPLATFWPSVNATLSSGPATWDRTWTIAEASTVPTTRSSVGTDSRAAFSAEMGTVGGPPGPLAWVVDGAFWHAARNTNDTVGMSRDNLGCMGTFACSSHSSRMRTPIPLNLDEERLISGHIIVASMLRNITRWHFAAVLDAGCARSWRLATMKGG